MANQMIVADNSVQTQPKEAVVIVAALAFVIALGGIAIAAIAICGWRGAKSVVMDWARGRAVFECR